MLNENDLELLSAYLDGALSQSERTALEARLQAEPELRRELARLRATVDLVKTLPTLTSPRPLTLTPRMVRRPSILTSATFSTLSAAAAVILLVIGAALFTTSQNNPGVPASVALSRSVALLPTDTLHALTGTSTKLSNASEANSPFPEATGEQGQNDLLQAVPTETLQLAFAAQSPQDNDANQQTQNGAIQPQAQSAFDNSQPEATPLPLGQQAAPLAMSSSATGGGASGAAVPAPVQLPNATLTPSHTPTLTPTHTATPTDTATAIASPTDTATPTPSPTPTSVLASLPSPENGAVGVGLIAVALVLLAAAAVTTILRRRE